MRTPTQACSLTPSATCVLAEYQNLQRLQAREEYTRDKGSWLVLWSCKQLADMVLKYDAVTESFSDFFL
jgi:hypothetical protein